VIRRLLFSLGCSLLLSGTAQAQIIPADNQEGKPPIELKLRTTSMMPCLDSEIPLTLELTNRGTADFKIDKYDIWNQFQYAFLGERSEGTGGGTGSSCGSCRGHFLILKSDETHESSFKFEFQLHREFFKDAGKYIIKLTIEGVPSNEVDFELINCN